MNADDEVNSQVTAEDTIGLSEKNAESHPEDKNKVEDPNDEGEDNGTTEDEKVESSKIAELENRNKELEEALLGVIMAFLIFHPKEVFPYLPP